MIEPPDSSKFAPEGDWTPIDFPNSHGIGASFIHGEPEGSRYRTALFVRESDRRLFARIWWGPGTEGPPGHAHGGSMAAVMDDIMGFSCWVAGHPVVAAKISVEFRRKLPLGTVATAEGWVTNIDGRKVTAAGRIYLDDPETPFASGEGLFIARSMEQFAGMLESATGKAAARIEHMADGETE